MVLLDGKKVAEALYSKLSLEISLLGTVPKIVFIMVGNNEASQTYVRSKAKKCSDLGLMSETIQLAEAVTEQEVCSHIQILNRKREVHGILVQLPLPSHLRKGKILREIDPMKDVDGLHPENAGLLMQGDPRFIPCTPAGILDLLKFYSIPIEGQKVVVMGRSEIVGRPIVQLMLMQNSTVTICHSKTREIEREASQADVLIVAVGRARFVGPSFVKEGAVVVDVGIHHIGDSLVGDVDFEAIKSRVAAMSPVPGGVGPMTIAMLMKNVVMAASLQSRSRISQAR